MSATPRWRQVGARLLLLALVAGGPLALAALLPRRQATDREGGRARAAQAQLPPRRAAPRQLPARLPRLRWQPVVDSTIAHASDFTLLGDTLVVLDRRTTQVVLLTERDGTWRQVASFGTRGGGPGELQRPVALAGIGDTLLAVLELGGRTQRFAPGGEYRGAERAALPCPMFAGELAYGERGVRYLSGNCASGAGSGDTIYTLLFQATGDDDYREVARVPRMGVDFSWGSPFATLHPLADHRGVILLALGLDACVVRLPPGGVGAPLRPTCGLAAERLTAPPPADWEARRAELLRRGDERQARLMRWPDALPVHVGLLPRGDSLFLLRPVSAESLVVVPAAVPFDAGRARLVAPLDHLVACRRGACLWFDPNEARLALVR